MAKVSLLPWKGKKSDDGQLPVYLVVRHKGSRATMATDLSLHPKHWNDRSGEVRKTHPNHHDLNRYLSGLRERAQAAIARRMADGTLTAKGVRNDVRDAPEEDEAPTGFLVFAEEMLEGYRERDQIGTWRSYRGVLSKFKKYLKVEHGRRSLPFDDLDVALLRGFRTWMKAERGNSQNTIHKGLRVIRTFLYQAIREGHFPQEENPFFHLTLRREKVKRDALSLEDMERIENHEVPPGSVMWDVRNMFVFSFYTGGPRFGDVLRTRWEHVDGGRLTYEMEKTGEASGIVLVDGAKEILQRYEDRKNKEFVFPLLDGRDIEGEANWNRVKSSRNSMANDFLKKIARRADIDGDPDSVSFHISRHSIAHLLYQKWGDMRKVQQILGHASMKQTERYLSGFEDLSLDDDFRDVFG